MANKTGGLLTKAQQENQIAKPQPSVSAMFNALVDKEGVKNRIQELMGKRAPQFTASMVSLVNATPQMRKVFQDAPMTIIQSCLRAASLDIPCDNALGLGYILPFYNSKSGKTEAQFILGYRGMYQLAMRTGAYERLNVCDIRETELVEYNRLTEDVTIEWLPDNERQNAKIIGYMGYFRMINGMTKTIYMTLEEIEAHEKAHRKGNSRNAIWDSNYEAMCAKTVLRRLIGKWGALSIDYKIADASTIAAAESIAKGQFDDEDNTLDIQAGNFEVTTMAEAEAEADLAPESAE